MPVCCSAFDVAAGDSTGKRRSNVPARLSGGFGPEPAEEAPVVGPHDLFDQSPAVVEPEDVDEVPDDSCSARLELPHG